MHKILLVAAISVIVFGAGILLASPLLLVLGATLGLFALPLMRYMPFENI